MAVLPIATKGAILKQEIYPNSSNFYAVPVEATPTTSNSIRSELTEATAVGGGSLAKQLIDIDNNSNNRIVQNAGQNRVETRFEPLVWSALSTDSGGTIPGIAIIQGSAPGDASDKFFCYVELTGGAFAPNGTDPLAVDFTTYPIAVSVHGSNFFDLARFDLMKGNYNLTNDFSMVLLVAAPDATWTQYSQISAIEVKNSSNNYLGKKLIDIGNNSNNRIIQNGNYWNVRFEPAIWTALDTNDNATPITHYCLVQGSNVYSSSKLVSWGQFLSSGAPSSFTADGQKNLFVDCSALVRL
ncbi:MAG: hypothetical protein J7647_32185 [Cyanobacteria bacterium SBLK]|nr:hypothetical protein [Cyanobacteria bacterium SBLK]